MAEELQFGYSWDHLFSSETERMESCTLSQGIERVSQTALTDQLERHSGKPALHLDLLWLLSDLLGQCAKEPSRYVEEQGSDVPHMCDGEHGVEHPSLLSMMVA